MLDATELAEAMATVLTGRAEAPRPSVSSRRLYMYPHRYHPMVVKERRVNTRRRLRALMEADARYWRPYWAFNPELGYDLSNVRQLRPWPVPPSSVEEG